MTKLKVGSGLDTLSGSVLSIISDSTYGENVVKIAPNGSNYGYIVVPLNSNFNWNIKARMDSGTDLYISLTDTLPGTNWYLPGNSMQIFMGYYNSNMILRQNNTNGPFIPFSTHDVNAHTFSIELTENVLKFSVDNAEYINQSITPISGLQYLVIQCMNGSLYVDEINDESQTITLPIADFTVDVASKLRPLIAKFTSQSGQGTNTYLWDFGDGKTSTEQDPTHLYDTPGAYDVSLTVTNSVGSDIKTKTGYIIVTDLQQDTASFDKKFAQTFDEWTQILANSGTSVVELDPTFNENVIDLYGPAWGNVSLITTPVNKHVGKLDLYFRFKEIAEDYMEGYPVPAITLYISKKVPVLNSGIHGEQGWWWEVSSKAHYNAIHSIYNDQVEEVLRGNPTYADTGIHKLSLETDGAGHWFFYYDDVLIKEVLDQRDFDIQYISIVSASGNCILDRLVYAQADPSNEQVLYSIIASTTANASIKKKINVQGNIQSDISLSARLLNLAKLISVTGNININSMLQSTIRKVIGLNGMINTNSSLSTTLLKSIIPSDNLCTFEEVKIESLGRIKDDTLKDTINYKITQLSGRIKEKARNKELTREDSTANLACIYGILAWLVLNKQIKQNKQVSSFKSGNLSINYTNSNTDSDNESTDCKIYKKLLLKLMPGPVLGDV